MINEEKLKKTGANKNCFKIINSAGNIIILMGMVILLYGGYLSYINMNTPQNSYILGYKPVIMSKNSMAPTIEKYDVAIVKKYNGEKLQKDDIIYYSLENNLEIIHRIEQIRDEGYITKADSNLLNDEYIVKKENVLGVVHGILNTSFIVRNYLAILIISSGIIFIFLVLSAFNKKKRKDENRSLDVK